jgi:RimJ/RimL family protein N-acetyltransferase
MSRPVLSTHWPLAALAVRTPRLELRWPDDDDLVALADLAAKGVHGPSFMPFTQPWTRADPGGELQRRVFQFHWRQRAEWTPESWNFNPVTVVDGEVVGTQGLFAQSFGVRRTAGTGSWLGAAHQGRGIGKEMRAAILHLLFAGLDALRAESGAFADNEASLGVTRSLGYRDNGELMIDREGSRTRELMFVLDRGDWEARRRDDIAIVGLAPCLPLFGVGLPGSGALAPRGDAVTSE